MENNLATVLQEGPVYNWVLGLVTKYDVSAMRIHLWARRDWVEFLADTEGPYCSEEEKEEEMESDTMEIKT